MLSSSASLQTIVELSRNPEGPPLKQVAKEFEALLLGELMRFAARPLPGGESLEGSAGRGYREQFYQEIARLVAEQGAFGLARQLEGQLNPEPDREERTAGETEVEA